MANEYGTVPELKAALGIAAADTADDSALGLALESASRMIDSATGRRFWQDALPVARRYQFESSGRVLTDDISTTVGLALAVDYDRDGVYEVAWVLGLDYSLYPLNALAEGRPATYVGSNGRLVPPKGPGTVQVTARYGWPAVPPEVRQATLIQALRLHQRRHSPFGVAGSPEVGSELRLLSRLDPDVEALVRPYVRGWYVVA